MIAKNFGEIPAAGELTAEDHGAPRPGRRRRSARVGDLIGAHRQKAAIGEAMRVVAEVNKYLSDQAPWKLKATTSATGSAPCCTSTAQCVADCNVAPRAVPAARGANAVDEVLGGTGDVAPMPRIDEVDDLDGGPSYPIITGDYRDTRALGPAPADRAGTPVAKPTPVFTKLDPADRRRGARPARG